MKFAGFAFADALEGQYKDERQLVEAVLGRLKIEARNDGWKGQFLVHAAWDAPKDRAPVVSIQIGPGHRELTVDDVRNFIKASRDAERAAAKEGRLL